jgi:hypothetical protein
VSTIKLKTRSDLESFLRILAEESVMSAQAGMQKPPEQQRQRQIVQQINKSKAALSEDDPEKTPPEAAKPAEPPPAEPTPEKTPTAKTPASADPDDFNPSISSLVDAIKDIRGGRGASDSAVEAELTSYFDRLEEAERIALIVMLRSIGGIMRQQLMGSDAKEPTDYNIFTTSKPSENQTKPQAAGTPAPVSAPTAAGGAEDAAPPIRVGEPVSESYRARIRDLLSRSR